MGASFNPAAAVNLPTQIIFNGFFGEGIVSGGGCEINSGSGYMHRDDLWGRGSLKFLSRAVRVMAVVIFTSKLISPFPKNSFRKKTMSDKRQSKSRQWRRQQEADPQVRAARAAGYRSRAAYKLLEINAALKFLRQGAQVVDLGAAPGGWSQVAAAAVGKSGVVVAVDLLPIKPLPGVCTVQGDFCDAAVVESVRRHLPNGVDTVLSDMSPNLSGIVTTDQSHAAALAAAALGFAAAVLQPGGCFVLKTFQGECFDETRRQIANLLQAKVRIFHLQSSRNKSREAYLCAKRAEML